jgi:hypothetical protein
MDKRQHSVDLISIFYSYAPEDEQFLHQLIKHLSPLRREGLIVDWHAGKTEAGSESAKSITDHLNTAAIILLLISPDFMMSDDCYNSEMPHALERQAQGQTCVIPILVRPVDWQSAPFAHLHCLPRNHQPVTLWPDKDAAFSEIVQAIRTEVEIRHGGTRTRRPSLVKQTVSPATSHQERNRLRFLKRVRVTWISGVLERSLYNDTLITLGLHEQPAAVANPWHLLVQETDGPAHPMQDGTRITQVYDDADGALLILGEPGAGKTTLLLELTRDLIERAESDPQQALPAIFNLSSWASKRQPLSAWLIEELHDKYNVPRKLGTTWIEHEQLLPLLDGLDEVAPEQRSACIAAVNQYRQEHNLTSLVVCSRSTEYLAQDTRLVLHRSVMVQPLTAQQIDDYLSSGGERLAAIRTALREDEGLQEMAAQPLMLNILTLTYQGMAPDDLSAIKSPAILRQQVFNRYVERMLQRRGVTTRYTPQQTKGWLLYLAKQMKLRNQTEFYIEHMQPDWVSKSRRQHIFSVLIAGLISILLFGLSAILIFGLAGLFFGSQQQNYVAAGLGGSLIHMTRICSPDGKCSPWQESYSRGCTPVGSNQICAWQDSPNQACVSETTPDRQICISEHGPRQACLSDEDSNSDIQVCVIRNGPHSFSDMSYSHGPPVAGTVQGGVTFALLFGFLSILVGGVISIRKRSIQPVEVVKWQWVGRWRRLLVGLLIGLGLGLLIRELFGLLTLFIYELLHMQSFSLQGFLQNVNSTSSQYIAENLFGLKDTLLFGGMGLLVGGVMSRISGDLMDKHIHQMPNEGILRSARYAVMSGLIVMLAGSGCVGLSTGPVEGLFFGLIVGIIIGFINGGIACIQHLLLRVRLWYERVIPWNYSLFLDYAAERILLRKVGGGYIFIHRLLLEYFAQLDDNTHIQATQKKVRMIENNDLKGH